MHLEVSYIPFRVLDLGVYILTVASCIYYLYKSLSRYTGLSLKGPVIFGYFKCF